MILFSEALAADNTVKDKSALTVAAALLARATRVLVQAVGQNVSATFDGTTVPSATVGIVFLTTSPPLDMQIDDFLRIKFTRTGGSNGTLAVTYSGGVV